MLLRTVRIARALWQFLVTWPKNDKVYFVVYPISVRKLHFNTVAILSTETDNLVRIQFRTRGETMAIVRWEQHSLLVGWHDNSALATLRCSSAFKHRDYGYCEPKLVVGFQFTFADWSKTWAPTVQSRISPIEHSYVSMLEGLSENLTVIQLLRQFLA
jgi:hypothetical protein